MNRNLWVASIGIMLLAWNLNGYATEDVMVTTLAGSAGNSGSADGTGSAARFSHPYGVAVDTSALCFSNNDTSLETITLHELCQHYS